MHSAPRLMCRRGQTLWLQMGMLGASGALGPWGPGFTGSQELPLRLSEQDLLGTRHGNRVRLQRCPGLVYRMASAWRSASRNSAAQPSKSGLCSMARSLRKSRSRRPERSGEDRTGTEGSCGEKGGAVRGSDRAELRSGSGSGAGGRPCKEHRTAPPHHTCADVAQARGHGNLSGILSVCGTRCRSTQPVALSSSDFSLELPASSASSASLSAFCADTGVGRNRLMAAMRCFA